MKIIGRFEPLDTIHRTAFSVSTREQNSDMSGWEGIRCDGKTTYNINANYWNWVAEPVSTLQMMLDDWCDLKVLALNAQADADALFEHAAECHAEISKRLSALGWGEPGVKNVKAMGRDEIDQYLYDEASKKFPTLKDWVNEDK